MPQIGPASAFPKVLVGSIVGPASYAVGGFVIDLSASASQIDFLGIEVETIGPNLPPCQLVIARNTPANGKATLKVLRHRYDRASLGDASAQNPPAGVSLAAASGQTAAASTATQNDPDAGVAGPSVVAANHTHVVNHLYQHGHAVTQTQTDAAAVELGAVDLSGTTFRYLAVCS